MLSPSPCGVARTNAVTGHPARAAKIWHRRCRSVPWCTCRQSSAKEVLRLEPNGPDFRTANVARREGLGATAGHWRRGVRKNARVGTAATPVDHHEGLRANAVADRRPCLPTTRAFARTPLRRCATLLPDR